MDVKYNDKANNLFQVLNRSFFNLLASNSDQEKNYAYLLAIDELFNGKETLYRDELVRGLEHYIRAHYQLTEVEGTSVYANEASGFVRALKDNGWLESSQGDNWNDLYSETEGFTKIIPVLKELAISDYSVPEYTRYLQGLHQDIVNFDYGSATNKIEEIEQYTDQLDRSLKTVNQKLKRFIRNSISKHGNNPKKIVHDLLYEYQATAPYKAFTNLTVRNNYNVLRSPILQGIQLLEEDESIDRIVTDYLKTKGRTDAKEAEDYIRFTLEHAYELVHNLESTINGISAKNRQYVDESVRKAKLEYADFKDIEGDIRNLFSELCKIDTEIFEKHDEWTFSFPDRSILSPESLRYPSRTNNKKDAVEYVRITHSPEAEKEAEELLRATEAFNELSVFEYIGKALGNRTSMKASEIQLSSENDLIKIILAAAFSTEPKCPFLITKMEEGFTWGEYQIDDFLITRRPKRHE